MRHHWVRSPKTPTSRRTDAPSSWRLSTLEIFIGPFAGQPQGGVSSGYDNEDVYGRLLGLDRAAIATLREKGTI